MAAWADVCRAQDTSASASQTVDGPTQDPASDAQATDKTVDAIPTEVSDTREPLDSKRPSLDAIDTDALLKAGAEQFQTAVSQVDSNVSIVNQALANVLFYDFELGRLPQFGAADIDTVPAAEFMQQTDRELFEVTIPKLMEDYKTRENDYPPSLKSVLKLLNENNITLPPLPHGVAYAFNSGKGQLMVEPRGKGAPAVAIFLVLAGLALTLRMRLITLRGLFHAIAVVLGRYDDRRTQGVFSHYRAFTTSLSCTLGLGGIAAVALAVAIGGPGAACWIMALGVLAMAVKFTESTLGHLYRRTSNSGDVTGGPMRYLQEGLKMRRFVGFSLAPMGQGLAVVFAFLCMLVALVLGGMLQVSQSLTTVQSLPQFESLQTQPWIFGAVMAFVAAVAFLAGGRVAGFVTSALAPIACLTYLCLCVWVIALRSDVALSAFTNIFTQAVASDASIAGGILGALVVGLTYAVMATDAGMGTTAVVNAGTQTNEPARVGIVAMVEPFVTGIVLTLATAMVMGVTGASQLPQSAEMVASGQGVALLSSAFAQVEVPTIATAIQIVFVLIAVTACIAWGYVGQRCALHLLGASFSRIFVMLFLAFVYLGSIIATSNVLMLSHLLLLLLAIPNLFGLFFLSGLVAEELDSYWSCYREGGFKQRREERTEMVAAAVAEK